MHQSPRRKIGPFYFVTGQKTSELVGDGLGVSVYISFEGKGIPVIECTLFLPSCHTTQATFVFARLPHEFLRYLRTGPLGQLHLATFGEDRIAAALPSRNSAFIQALKEATSAYLRKHGRSTVTERPPHEAENQ